MFLNISVKFWRTDEWLVTAQVSTTGYTQFNIERSFEYKWLLVYMWVSILVCGLFLGVVVGIAHDAVEDRGGNHAARCRRVRSGRAPEHLGAVRDRAASSVLTVISVSRDARRVISRRTGTPHTREWR